MIQFARSPYQSSMTLAAGPLVPLPSSQTAPPLPADVSSGQEPVTETTSDEGFIEETPWYKRPLVWAVAAGGVAALGGLAYWAFKAPKRRRR